jgi:beta-galactosidase
MKNKIFSAIGLVCLFGWVSNTNISIISKTLAERKMENLNAGWSYLENETEDILELASQKEWLNIDLPHTWNQWDAVDNAPGYRRSASWYQKELFIEDYHNAQYLLYFEGANITTALYVNGQLAGKHVGGYVGFEFDITPYIKKGQVNTLSVRVDNSYNPDIIPSQKADFFIYGGITRDVWLKILPKVNVQRVYVSTPEVSEKSASTSLKMDLHNEQLLKESFQINAKLLAPSTKEVVAEKSVRAIDLKGGKSFSLPPIENPKLWSPEQPQLYTIVIQILEGTRVIDQREETIGYRWFHFEDHGAFFLNGKRILLRGTHRHEEHAGYGAAMPNALHRKDIEQIKDLGANFLRLGHYPQDPEIYKACNELGIIVWDELPWCRGGMGEATWQANTKRLLTEQIKQNFNHPSILFWSLGNEIYWLPDFENGDDETRLNRFLKDLHDTAHVLDPNRMTAIRKYYAGADIVDVFSPSIWSGWYAGVYTNYEQTLSKNQQKYPRFLHMEYGGSSHVGRHTENPITGDGAMKEDDWAEVANQVNIKNIAKSGDWTENYIVDLFDWYLGVTETKADFSGNAQWAFKDFGTPLRPENAIPYLNQKGLVDRAGKPKDAYYVFKSYWSKDPFTYIESHTWTERRGPKGKARALSVFSNCEQVELFNNQNSLGTKRRQPGNFPASGLTWDVQFTKGKNHLLARGMTDGKVVASDTMTVNYDYTPSGKPDHIQLTYRTLPNGHYLIEAFMLDKQNARVLDYEKHLYFSKDGAGELLKNYGTPTRSQVIQMANGYAAIELIPAKSGKAIIEARNQDFKGSYLVFDFDEIRQGQKTQALLLTQPFDFDPTDKNKVTGDYVAQTKITVPQNLATQSKWIMFEGPVLENDVVAYRYYADSRHRFDIYGKTVPDLVMDTVGWKYHDIMDWGSDVLKVGNSLGLGSPAIWYQDTLYTLSNCKEKTIEILTSDEDQSIIRTTFTELTIEGHSFDLIQDWSISAGQPWSEITLTVPNGTLPKGMHFATGIVKHLPAISQGETTDYFYAMNWGKQSFHKENMGMAIVAPKMYTPQKVSDALSHAYIFKNAKEEVRYRFLSAWERDNNNVKDAAGFKKLVEASGN